MHAATFEVTDAAGLIAAINTANGNSEADTLNLGGSIITLAEADATDSSNGLPVITSVITINGQGGTITRSSAENTPNFRIFRVNSGGNLTLNQVTVSNGRAPDESPGGAISNGGTLTLTNSTLSGNTAGSGSSGGAIFNSGTLTVINSALSGNTAGNGVFGGGGGGAISNTGGTLTLTNSTLSGNTAGNGGSGPFVSGGSGGSGGGISNGVGTLTVTNSTLSGNTAGNGGNGSSGFPGSNGSNGGNGGNGGGISNAGGTLTITNSTLSGNTAGSGGSGGSGGVGFMGGSSGSSGSSGGVGVGPEVFTNEGSVVANHNVFGLNDSAGIFGYDPATGTGNVVPEAEVMVEDILAPLANNGGPTQTHALVANSPAIDAGDANACADADTVNNLDQRGGTRPAGMVCDIGAFELGALVAQTLNTAATGDEDVTVASTNIITDLVVSDPAAEGYTAPAGMAFSDAGLYSFVVTGVSTGGTTTVTITLPTGTNPIGYAKCDAMTKVCTAFPAPTAPGMQGAVVSGDTITLTLIDGMTPGDSDMVDGQITDPGVALIATPSATTSPAPRRSSGALGALLLAPLALLVMLRRRQLR